MKRKTAVILAKLLAVLLLLAGLFFLLPKTNCCVESDPEFENLIDRGFAGEIEAIVELYERAKKNGVKPDEEYWALEGALRGNNMLRSAYVEIFNTQIDADRQQRLLRHIRERSAMPGTPCVLELLGDPTQKLSACPQ